MRHFSKVRIKRADISQYRQFGPKRYNRLVKLGEKIKNTTIVHVNATARGGGVAEILHSQVPLERSLGLNSIWLALIAPAEYFEVTKKIHNQMQGQTGALGDEQKLTYLNHLNTLGGELARFLKRLKGATLVVLHDPQTIPIINYLPAGVRNALRIHIDLSHPNAHTMEFLKPYIKKFNRVIMSNPKFRPKWLSKKQTIISYPAINPFNVKNRYMPETRAKTILKKIGIDTTRPLITQVSRFDRWKDPFGVIEAYLLAKKKIPGLQLLLEGFSIAKDDPEGKTTYKRLAKQFNGDRDLYILGDPKILQKIRINFEAFVNAAQRGSDIVLQKSVKEGFGMTVTEGMWKGKPVIGGNVGGIKLQIKNGVNGYLVDSPEDCAGRIIQILKNPRLAKRIGRQAHKTVRQNFLMPSLLLAHLKLYRELR